MKMYCSSPVCGKGSVLQLRNWKQRERERGWSGVNFINIFQEAFTLTDPPHPPKKIQSSRQSFFALLGSSPLKLCVKC